MSWQDEMRANGYVNAALKANSDRELEQGMRAVDNGVDMIDNVINGIGRALTEPSPPPKSSSSGSGLGGLLVLGALAGGAYLLSKVFGGDDDKKSSNSSLNGVNATNAKSDFVEAK